MIAPWWVDSGEALDMRRCHRLRTGVQLVDVIERQHDSGSKRGGGIPAITSARMVGGVTGRLAIRTDRCVNSRGTYEDVFPERESRPFEAEDPQRIRSVGGESGQPLEPRVGRTHPMFHVKQVHRG